MPDNTLSQNSDSDTGLFSSVCNLVVNLLDDEDKNTVLKPDTRLEDLGFDSIKYIHLLLSLEDIVEIDLEKIVSEIDISQIQTIGDITGLIGKLKKQ